MYKPALHCRKQLKARWNRQPRQLPSTGRTDSAVSPKMKAACREFTAPTQGGLHYIVPALWSPEPWWGRSAQGSPMAHPCHLSEAQCQHLQLLWDKRRATSRGETSGRWMNGEENLSCVLANALRVDRPCKLHSPGLGHRKNGRPPDLLRGPNDNNLETYINIISTSVRSWLLASLLQEHRPPWWWCRGGGVPWSCSGPAAAAFAAWSRGPSPLLHSSSSRCSRMLGSESDGIAKPSWWSWWC